MQSFLGESASEREPIEKQSTMGEEKRKEMMQRMGRKLYRKYMSDENNGVDDERNSQNQANESSAGNNNSVNQSVIQPKQNLPSETEINARKKSNLTLNNLKLLNFDKI